MKAKLFTATPDALLRYGVLYTKSGRKLSRSPPFALPKRARAVITFERGRPQCEAEALKGVELFVDRAALHRRRTRKSFYHAPDLIGLEVRDSEGRVLGRVSALHNFGASDVLEFARSDGDTVHIAFTRETVPVIHVAEGAYYCCCAGRRRRQ